MHSAHISKTAARAAYGKLFSETASEEEQAGIFFSGIGCLFLFGVNVVKNGFSGTGTMP